jgi:hypothetical protein
LVLLRAAREALGALKTDSSVLEKMAKEHPLILATNRFLSAKVEEDTANALNSLRLFFLKDFYRSEGTQFAQQVFGIAPFVSAFPWLSGWRDSDSRVDHFLRKQHLVPFDPFTKIPTNYSDSRDSVRAAVDGELETLSKQLEVANQPINKAALLYALFQEVETLYTAKELSPSTTENVKKLRTWIESTFTQEESPVLRAFTLPALSLSSGKFDESVDYQAFLSFNKNMTSARMLQLGCVVRAAGIALASQPHNSLNFFYYALTKPTALAKVFCPRCLRYSSCPDGDYGGRVV